MVREILLKFKQEIWRVRKELGSVLLLLVNRLQNFSSSLYRWLHKVLSLSHLAQRTGPFEFLFVLFQGSVDRFPILYIDY